MSGLTQRDEAPDITLFGETRCHKTRFYMQALEDRGLSYELAEVDKDDLARERLTVLTGDATKFPTFEIKGRKLRNPKLPELDKRLARAGLYDPGIQHDERQQKFLQYMEPSDAFVRYSKSGDAIAINHIEIDISNRGKGLGKAFARRVLEHLADLPPPVAIDCKFLQDIATENETWRNRFKTRD